MALDITNMTPEELEAHVETELALRAEIEEILADLSAANYRTKTEKMAKNANLAAKRRELNIHLGYE
jgi:UDP:flavonoid glycosyltransferase YjiC (YdhE family)